MIQPTNSQTNKPLQTNTDTSTTENKKKEQTSATAKNFSSLA
jgi:hypothetical protein